MSLKKRVVLQWVSSPNINTINWFIRKFITVSIDKYFILLKSF